MINENEIEAIYSSINDRYQKEKKYTFITNITTLFCAASFFISIFIIVPRGSLQFAFILVIIFSIVWGVSIMKFNPMTIKVFNSEKEELFYYLYGTWKSRYNEESKRLLTEAIRKIEDNIEVYKELLFTDMITTLSNRLKDLLKFCVYGNLGGTVKVERTQNPEKIADGWNELKKLSIKIFEGVPIQEIEQNINAFSELFPRDEEVKLFDEAEPLFAKVSTKIKSTVTSFSYKYNSMWLVRLVTWSILTLLGDYVLYSLKNVPIEALLSTAIIPFIATSYLVEKR